MKKAKALFISLEGGEGAGKSTLMRRLSAFYTEEGIPFYCTREPGGTPFGEKVRHLLLNEREASPGERAELLLFLSARADHVEKVIWPKIEAGITVLCDRFQDSTIAYQGIARGLGLEQVYELSLFATNGLEPDITFFLDVDPKTGFARAQGRVADRLEEEGLAFHERVYAGFLKLQSLFPERIIRLNGQLPEEALFQEARDVLLAHRHSH